MKTLLCGAKREKVLPKKATKLLKEQFGKAVPCGALAAAHLGKTATPTQIVKTGIRVVTKKVVTKKMVTQTATKVGEGTMKTGVTMASKEAAIPIPFVGGRVRNVVGGLARSFMANITANAALR